MSIKVRLIMTMSLIIRSSLFRSLYGQELLQRGVKFLRSFQLVEVSHVRDEQKLRSGDAALSRAIRKNTPYSGGIG